MALVGNGICGRAAPVGLLKRGLGVASAGDEPFDRVEQLVAEGVLLSSTVGGAGFLSASTLATRVSTGIERGRRIERVLRLFGLAGRFAFLCLHRFQVMSTA